MSSITPGVSFVRSTASSSTGGPRRSLSPGPPSSAKAPTASMMRRSGISPSSHAGIRLERSSSTVAARPSIRMTSKNPCQPSSVNSDWCAWNMNLPGWAKRHSRMPRWPWHSITVSVNSDGVFEVPVGK